MDGKHNDLVSSQQESTAPDGETNWKSHWRRMGQSWRTQPEIDDARQRFLLHRLTITPDIARGIYPFIDIELGRADVEWLLAQHDNGRGPVFFDDPTQMERMGLDLRGADLHQVDLSGLPLARLRGGLSTAAHERDRTTIEQSAQAAIHFEGADLGEAHLEGAILEVAHLERTWCVGAHLEGASLISAHLERADLSEAHLEGADLRRAHLEGAWLARARLGSKRIQEVPSGEAQPHEVTTKVLPPADLRRAYFDTACYFEGVVFGDPAGGFALFADLSWYGANLATVEWSHMTMVGDEYQARASRSLSGETKTADQRLSEYISAVRATRQLATALQAQGLNEVASYFAYRAQRLQREVLRRQGRVGQYIFSLLLDSIAGYGYKPGRSLVAYSSIILAFTGLYLLNSQFSLPHLRWDEALVLSISSFHGRGFFSQSVTLGDTYARLAAAEAIVGLFIEISFIATFTQRFFGK